MGMIWDNASVGFTAEAGEDITIGQMVAIHTDGKAYKANAKTGAGQQIPAVGIAEVTVAAGGYIEIKRWGHVSGAADLTVGAPVYLAETDGAVTATPPSDAGDIVQYVGIALSATDFLLDVELGYSTVASS